MSTVLPMPGGDSGDESEWEPNQATAEDRRSLWRKFRMTPLADMLRGRISARYDYRYLAESSGLPEAIQACVLFVSRQARLKRHERVDVAHELLAHFQDAQAHMASEDKQMNAALEAFGDQRMAAKLIRRAKLRCRPLYSKLITRSRHALYVLSILYVLMLGYYALGRPAVSVDYIEKINQASAHISPEQRTFMAYPEVLATIDRKAFSEICLLQNRELPVDERTPKQIQAMRDFLSSHQAAITRLHELTHYPSLGYFYGHGLTYEFWPDQVTYKKMQAYFERDDFDDPAKNQAYHDVLLPALGGARDLARLFLLDAQLALMDQQPDRAVINWLAAIRLSEQLRGPSLVEHLVRFSLLNLIVREFGQLTREELAMINDKQLKDLAHAISARHLVESIDLESERYFFYDIVQRMYSDRGEGAGLAIDCFRVLSNYDGYTIRQEPYGRFAMMVGLMPAINIVMASRGEMLAEYDRLMDLQQLRFDRPYWRTHDMNSVEDELGKWSMMRHYRYFLISTLLPALERVGATKANAEMNRDGMLLKLALELYRRRHGGYPDSLVELVPGYLPELPIDQMTGKPLSYRKGEDGYAVYSFGSDLDDDGGRSPLHGLAEKDFDGLKQVAREQGLFTHRVSDFRQMKEDATNLGRKAFDADWLIVSEGTERVDEKAILDRIEVLLEEGQAREESNRRK